MSETVEPTSHGSYDDVPDEHVATVLNVPLRLNETPPSSTPIGGELPTQMPPGNGRHRKPDAPVEAGEDHVVPQLTGQKALPPPRRRTPRTPRTPPSPHSTPTDDGSNNHWRATLKVGAISAAIVFGAAALTLVALTWLP